MLEGVRVVEVAAVITGPLAGMTLADLGADVIKVEPLRGDQFRGWDGTAAGVRPSFAAINRGKRSIGVDLKSERGRKIVLDLIGDADVLIENLRSGAMTRLGLGSDVLLSRNPRLVYCSVTGMGTGGPESNRPMYDSVAQAMSGLWSQLSEPAESRVVGPPMADQLTGLYSSIAILAALRERDVTGVGRELEISMLASCLAFQGLSVAAYAENGEVPAPTTRSVNSQSYAFVAADGKPFSVHLSTPHRFWVALCEVAGVPELATDPRFETKGERIAHYDELRRQLATAFAGGTRDEWMKRLAKADVPSAPILDLGEALSHPHVRALGLIDPVSDADRSATEGLVKSPIISEGRAFVSNRPAPYLDEHTDEILRSVGCTAEQIEELRKAGVVNRRPQTAVAT